MVWHYLPGSFDQDGILSIGALCVPEFVSAFKVSIRMKSCGKWYLGCSCKFGKRYGSPCTHMFHVFNEYLKDIGVVEWCYKDVSFIHWSLYSYVYATMGNTDSTLTQDELSWLDYFNKNDPTEYADVKCVFDIDSFEIILLKMKNMMFVIVDF